MGERSPDERPTEPTSHEEARPGVPATTVAKVVIGLLVLVLFIVFVIQNSHPVTVDFVFVQTRVRLIWVFLACAIIGAVVAYLLGRGRRRTTGRYIRELERRTEKD